MPTISINPGETLSELSSRVFGGDVLRFGEILDLNPDMDVFEELPQTQIEIPGAEQILNFAQPMLTQIRESIASAGRYLEQAQSTLSEISQKLPPQLQGYTKEALVLVSQLNDFQDEAEQFLDDSTALATNKLKEYEGKLEQLIPWILNSQPHTLE